MTNRYPLVLLADDDTDDRHFFCSAMQRLYPHVDLCTFGDGDQVLEYLGRCNPGMLPRCILLDYNMPPFTAPQILHATGPGTQYALIPKIVWSTSRRKQEMEECLSLGATRFIIKPATDAELDEVVRSLEHWIFRQNVF
jgi:CheY-like chemotaxis protein